jgi:hypothetical protein
MGSVTIERVTFRSDMAYPRVQTRIQEASCPCEFRAQGQAFRGRDLGLSLCVCARIDADRLQGFLGRGGTPRRTRLHCLEAHSTRQQLAVTLRSGDGTVRDGTHHCRFVVEPIT